MRSSATSYPGSAHHPESLFGRDVWEAKCQSGRELAVRGVISRLTRGKRGKERVSEFERLVVGKIDEER